MWKHRGLLIRGALPAVLRVSPTFYADRASLIVRRRTRPTRRAVAIASKFYPRADRDKLSILFPPSAPSLARFRGDSRLSLEFSFASQLIAAKNRGGSASISGRPNFAIPVCIRVRLRTRWLVVHTRLRFNARLLSNLLFFLAPPSLSYSSLDSIRPSLATDFRSISRIENDNFPRRIFPSLLPYFRYTRC